MEKLILLVGAFVAGILLVLLLVLVKAWLFAAVFNWLAPTLGWSLRLSLWQAAAIVWLLGLLWPSRGSSK